MSLITDQKKLLKLALTLAVDVEYLVQSIKNDPAPNEGARSDFLDGFNLFTEEAIVEKVQPQDLLQFDDPKETPGVPLQTAQKTHSSSASTSRDDNDDISYLYQSEVADCRSAVIAPAAISTTSEDTALATPALATFSLRSAQVFSPYGPSTIVAAATPSHLLGVDPGRTRCPKARNTPRTSIYISNAPAHTTSSMIAAQICGGPLGSLERYPHPDNCGSNFMVNFINPSTASAYMAFSKTPAGQLCFASLPCKRGSLIVKWADNSYLMSSQVRAGLGGLNPVRRTLIIQNYPTATVGKEEFAKRFKAIEVKFYFGFSIESFDIDQTSSEACIVFSKIAGAMQVKNWHSSGLLGKEFNSCQIIYGKDPCDRPIPVREIKTEVKPPAKGSIRVPSMADLPAPSRSFVSDHTEVARTLLADTLDSQRQGSSSAPKSTALLGFSGPLPASTFKKRRPIAAAPASSSPGAPACGTHRPDLPPAPSARSVRLSAPCTPVSCFSSPASTISPDPTYQDTTSAIRSYSTSTSSASLDDLTLFRFPSVPRDSNKYSSTDPHAHLPTSARPTLVDLPLDLPAPRHSSGSAPGYQSSGRPTRVSFSLNGLSPSNLTPSGPAKVCRPSTPRRFIVHPSPDQLAPTATITNTENLAAKQLSYTTSARPVKSVHFAPVARVFPGMVDFEEMLFNKHE